MGDFDRFGLLMNLSLGPHPGDGEWTMEQLRRGWVAFGAEAMRGQRPGVRCWGWWAFVAGEDPPEGEPAQALRLLELGALAGDELEAVRARAHEAIRGIEWERHLEDIHAVVTSPAAAREAMRARDDANEAGWTAVLRAVDEAPAQVRSATRGTPAA